jgi:hypothetical protein
MATVTSAISIDIVCVCVCVCVCVYVCTCMCVCTYRDDVTGYEFQDVIVRTILKVAGQADRRFEYQPHHQLTLGQAVSTMDFLSCFFI